MPSRVGNAAPPSPKKDSAMQGFLKIEGLSKSFVPAKPVFANVSFMLDKGEFVCIIGHSGCGKTTILNVLAGLDTASSGHVFMDGREVAGPSLERGVVFQNHSLLPWLSVYENVKLAVDKVSAGKKSRAERRDWVMHNLALVQMTHAKNQRPSEISGA